MRTPAAPLASFEVTVGCRGAAFPRLQLIRVHAQTHGTARFAPVKASLDKNLTRPISSAMAFTRPEPGTIIASTPSATCLPSTILAASFKSSIRALVQDPMKTLSILMSCIFVPALSPIYSSIRLAEACLLSDEKLSGAGTSPVMATTSSGVVPHVTVGAISAALMMISLS